jgi:hypothetical protein
MNYLAHGWRFVDDPYFLAGTAVPDWLCVADRGVRVRSKHAAQWTADEDPVVAALARGVCQHHADDRWFHESRAFTELSLDFSARIRRALVAEEGLRPWFLGHILVEILLDAVLVEQHIGRLEAYYRAMDQIDPSLVEKTVNHIAPHPTARLAEFICTFRSARFLWDYADDGKLLVRLNQVMRRTRLRALPASFGELLPRMRFAVRERGDELLAAPTVGSVASKVRLTSE